MKRQRNPIKINIEHLGNYVYVSFAAIIGLVFAAWWFCNFEILTKRH
jgi:hypothetical protein